VSTLGKKKKGTQEKQKGQEKRQGGRREKSQMSRKKGKVPEVWDSKPRKQGSRTTVWVKARCQTTDWGGVGTRGKDREEEFKMGERGGISHGAKKKKKKQR